MKKCKICGSSTINEHLHGRLIGEDLDLCDVCYWRKRADGFKKEELTTEQRKFLVSLIDGIERGPYNTYFECLKNERDIAMSLYKMGLITFEEHKTPERDAETFMAALTEKGYEALNLD